MKKNDLLPLTITDVALTGSGVGHIDGMAVFVPASAVGDELTVQILKVKSKYAYARIHTIHKPSEWRNEPDCPVFPKCGGCLFRHMTYEAELQLKEHQVQQNMARIGHYNGEISPITGSPVVDGYRNKAQYPLSLQNGKLSIGFFAPRSHRVMDCRSCKLQPAVFEEILRVFDAWILENKISVYNELTGKGLIRHIYIREASQTSQILVCIVATAAKLPHSDALCTALTNAVPSVKSIVLNVNADDTNVILGKKCIPLFGDGYIEDILCGKRFRLNALSFYQVNRTQAENLYRKAAEYAEPDGEVVLDLYCGAGTIGLSMADKAKEIIGVEIVPEAIEDAKYNAQLNDVHNARFLCADAAEAAVKLEQEGIKPGVILVDPPRKGCSPELLDTIFRFAPKRLVYVSCDSATLARDVAILQEGGYKVEQVAPFDMFPRTGHVETVVLMSKVNTTR